MLLWGEKAGKTALPVARRGGGTVARRVATSGGKALDAGLKVLPEWAATKVRSSVRKVARTVLH